MSNLQEIVDRLEALLNQEGAKEPELRKIERKFEEANMVGTLPTEDVGNFCHNLLYALNELTPWAIAKPTKPLARYKTSWGLVNAMIPANDHLD